MIKTSADSPLEIETVTPDGTNGSIGMTLCPGRKGTSQAHGMWDRDLPADLAVIAAWRPDLVLSLLESHEYATLGIPHFETAVIAAGLPWVFAPMTDGGVSDARFERDWVELGSRVRAISRDGGRVLVHCRAGLGRTGLVAACLLIDFGAAPADALARVRVGRPNRVERGAQEAYVLEYRAPSGD